MRIQYARVGVAYSFFKVAPSQPHATSPLTHLVVFRHQADSENFWRTLHHPRSIFIVSKTNFCHVCYSNVVAASSSFKGVHQHRTGRPAALQYARASPQHAIFPRFSPRHGFSTVRLYQLVRFSGVTCMSPGGGLHAAGLTVAHLATNAHVPSHIKSDFS